MIEKFININSPVLLWDFETPDFIFDFLICSKERFSVYIAEEFRHMGIGKMIFEAVLEKHTEVKTWYVDTILEEDHNVNFYKQAGFVEIEREVEHEGLSFVTLIKKR